jgi:hypothetical protein
MKIATVRWQQSRQWPRRPMQVKLAARLIGTPIPNAKQSALSIIGSISGARAMAARLGEVLFWASSLVASLLVGLVAYLVVSDRRDERAHREANCTTRHRGGVDTVLVSTLVCMAIVIWLIGRAALYVLAGS